MRKKLIEVALPLEAINAASAREKSIRHGHPSTLHLWWARRPLAAARAVIFTSLVDDPDDPNAPPEFVEACRKLRKGANANVEDTPRQRLFDFIELLVKWESTTDEKILEQARELIRLSTDGNPPPLLDPFAGGGSIPLEAQRLGLEAHASDLNPVAVMINKALIEIPPRFANMPPVNPRDREKIGGQTGWKGAQGLAADVRYYGEWMRDRAWERIGHLYPPGPNGETVIAWLWARTVKSPNPAVEVKVPLVRSFGISKRKGRKAWVEPIVDKQTKQVSFTVHSDNRQPPDGTVNRSGGRCIVSDVPIPFEYIREQGQAGKLGAQMLAIITEGERGRNYHTPTAEHEQVAIAAFPDAAPNTFLPTQALGFRIQGYGMTQHKDLFTSRQLVALITLCDLVNEVCQTIEKDAIAAGMSQDRTPLREKGGCAYAYAEAVSVYLGITVSRQANRLSSMCFWDTQRENVQQVFARQALPMNWDYVEANPFSNSSGNFLGQTNYVISMLEKLGSTTSGHVSQQDATGINYPFQMVISTDPPYYDNIGYADLSDYFYIWLRRAISPYYPDLFSTMLTPKEQELIAEPGRHDSSEEASLFFEEGLFKVFEQTRTFAHSDFPLSIFYAFKQSEVVSEENVSSTGWEVFLSGLVGAGFRILGTWPVRTEQPGGLRVVGRNALASSIVLVCRPRTDDAPQTSRRDFVNALRRELPAALREMQSGSIAPVDLAQSSIGPGMAIYSRYSRVLEADGSPMTVRTALQLINQELDAFLAETEGDVDSDTRFCINWFEQFGFNEGEFGVADVLARAKNTSVDGLVNAGVIQATAGKVRLYQWEELDPGWTPQGDKRVTVWEAVHHLIERLNTYGESGAAALLQHMNSDLAAETKNLAYRLYQICDRKNWSEHALNYNALVQSWPRLQELANELKQNQSSEQLGLL